jgi:heme/copper-type cytochrome/quinol oxidase subunit 3
MSIERSRTADPVVDVPRGLTMGSWAMWLLITALSTGLAGLAAAGLYLHTGQAAWPPPELTRPGGGMALLALLLVVAVAVLTHRAKVRLRTGALRSAASLLLAAVAVSLAAVLTLARDLAGSGFRWDAHAYASVYWVTTGTAAVFVAIGALLLAAVLVQRLTGVVDPTRMLELEVTAGYVWWTVGAVAVCLAVAHLLPDPSAAAAARSAVAIAELRA